MKNKELDQLFKKKFEDFQPNVSAQNWQFIEKKISEQRTWRKRKSMFQWTSVAALIVLVLSIAWFLKEGHPNRSTINQSIAFHHPEHQNTSVSKRKNVNPTHGTDAARSDRASAPRTPINREIQESAQHIDGHSAPGPSDFIDDIYVLQAPAIVTEHVLSDKSLPQIREKAIPVLQAIALETSESDYYLAYQEVQEEVTAVKKAVRKVGVTSILNTVVNTVYNDEDAAKVFSEDEEGIIRVDFSALLSKR